jgi:uncharacterized protein YneF (UPF0154 family)
MEEGKSVASNFIWALALIVIVAIIMGALYYGGFFSQRQQKQEIEVDVKLPSVSNSQ